MDAAVRARRTVVESRGEVWFVVPAELIRGGRGSRLALLLGPCR